MLLSMHSSLWSSARLVADWKASLGNCGSGSHGFRLRHQQSFLALIFDPATHRFSLIMSLGTEFGSF